MRDTLLSLSPKTLVVHLRLSPFFFKNVKACLWEGLNSRGATGKLSAIVHDKCGYFWGSEEEVIHRTINTGSLTVSDHVDSSDGDSAVSERTHS